MSRSRYDFTPERYEQALVQAIEALRGSSASDSRSLTRILKRYPKDGKGPFSKAELIRGFRTFATRYGWQDEERSFLEMLRMKPVRTLSGVAPVTVLTKPFPCPGRCVFCPSDVRMPKSYLAMEPGAQRASQNGFDPYAQTASRLQAFHNNGHRIDKTELLVLGGTWSFYPEEYQVWFIARCFEALNEFSDLGWTEEAARGRAQALKFGEAGRPSGPASSRADYNEVVSSFLRERQGGRLIAPEEQVGWERLITAHRVNETARVRCVGLTVETRPDYVNEAEVIRLRRLGVTKVQLGVQSLSDPILLRNERGHDVAATRSAIRLLREAGFKIQVHWMPNLLGATPQADLEDFRRLFTEPECRPDELKIYPLSLIESTGLMAAYQSGEWRPYSDEELLELLVSCVRETPAYCRITRVVRDIPSHDIVAGNKRSNFRELVTREIQARGLRVEEIRSREIRGTSVREGALELRTREYASSSGRELFLSFETDNDRLAAFLRLSLPGAGSFIEEIAASAMIREVHVYGALRSLGEGSAGAAQHLGLGGRLVEEAAGLALAAGFRDLAVISAVGTREYYRRLDFRDGPLYLHRRLSSR